MRYWLLLLIAAAVVVVVKLSWAECQEGLQQSCGFSSEGDCRLGVMICQNGEWTPCLGAKGPQQEVCFDGHDNDCDGQIDEGCECKSGDTRVCGSTNGICKQGVEHCTNGVWNGTCDGGFLGYPTEFCDNTLDDNCNGEVNEGCTVVVNESCSDGIQNQQETGIDCGGVCQSCVVENDSSPSFVQPPALHTPKETVETPEEQAVCGDGFCDATENGQTCNIDCGASGQSSSFVFFVVGLIAVVGLVAAAWWFYRRFTQKLEKPQREQSRTMVDLQKVRQLELQRKEYKNKTEDHLERSLKQFEKTLK